MDPTPKDLTPEERLFKVIQESEKAREKDDTLIVSSEKTSVPPPSAAPTPAPEPGFGFDSELASGLAETRRAPEPELLSDLPEPDIQAKKARRAMALSAASAGSMLEGLLQKLFSLASINKFLSVIAIGLFLYFSLNHLFIRKSPVELFMKRADAMNAPAIEFSTDIFSTESIDRHAEALAKRNAFRPWAPAPPPQPAAGAAGSGGVAGPTAYSPPNSSLAAVSANLKLSGIYLSDIPEALVEVVDEKKTYAVSAGSKVKGLTVKEVKSTGVVFTDGQSEYFLQ